MVRDKLLVLCTKGILEETATAKKDANLSLPHPHAHSQGVRHVGLAVRMDGRGGPDMDAGGWHREARDRLSHVPRLCL